MSEKPRVQTAIRDFPGIVLQADAHDLKPGAMQEQVNIRSEEQGRAVARSGMLQVAFDYEG